jgi:hypothetical protein
MERQRRPPFTAHQRPNRTRLPPVKTREIPCSQRTPPKLARKRAAYNRNCVAPCYTFPVPKVSKKMNETRAHIADPTVVQEPEIRGKAREGKILFQS